MDNVPYGKTRAGFGKGFYQIYGVGDKRHDVYGTVEKVYGGWFAVAYHGAERSCATLKEGAQWVANKTGGQDGQR